METTDVESTIDRVLDGDVDAFAAIVRAFQDDVWRVASYGLRDMEATEEIVQQAFVNAFFHLDRFRRGKDFGAWLRGIARNLVRMEMRNRNRYTRRLIAYRNFINDRFTDNGSADRHGERLHEALEECTEALSPPATEALDLRYRQALGFEAIARKLGRTVAATRQMLGRIRLSLRNCIEERTAQS